MQSTKAVLLLMSFFLAKLACAQPDELIIHGQTGKLYLEHTVVAKDNWYSVGRLYNVNPKELAPFNKLTLGKALIIGQLLEIPLTAVNFSQNGIKTASETLVPVFHITQEKEWMYRISVNHNKVPYTDIEKWNNITADQIHPGMHLIVGYLKVKTALSALAARKPEAVAEHPAQVLSTVSDSPKAVIPVTTPPPVNQPATPVSTTAAPHFNGGVFGADYSDGGKSTTGMAGIFKSTSGWQDGKYYALMNNIAVGTIVRVTDPATGKIIYAKVLGQLPDMKESNGLTIRISNAAAAELGAGDGKFNVLVNY